MSLFTQWGYSVDDDTLPALLTPIELDALTAGKYIGDGRVVRNIAAASAAIRNYCGWHITPSEVCTFSEPIMYGNGRIKPVGPDLLIQLPTTYLTEVTSVVIGAEAHTDFLADPSGLVRVFDVPACLLNRKTKVTIVYTAGFPDDRIPGIKDLIANKVAHSLAAPNGVQSESAGGVSVTYSTSWINSANSSGLGNDAKEVLEPFRVQGVY
jgi:hypothetical protein